jgi:hypothetical protein
MQQASNLGRFLDKWPKRQNMYIGFGTWKVKNLYRTGSLVIVSKELSKYKLYLVGVQKVKWEGGANEPAG